MDDGQVTLDGEVRDFPARRTILARTYRGPLADWRSLVPFVIRLRDYPDGELPRPQEYPLKLAKELPDAPHGWMDSLLKNGRALLMLDGVDEVQRALRG